MNPQLTYGRYLAELREVLIQDWKSLAHEGDSLILPHDEKFETVKVLTTKTKLGTIECTAITRIPTGSFIAWTYTLDALHENDSKISSDFTEVEPHVRLVEVTEYVPLSISK